MSEPRRVKVDANGVSLNVYQLTDSVETGSQPPVIMLHGMRDVGLSLLPIAEAIAREHPVYLMDLRGHGWSDQPGNYAMVQHVFDLHAVLATLAETPSILFGHSLGGQIVCRFAALYPELAHAAVVVEGLGPPARRHHQDPAEAMRMEGERILQTLSIPETQRPLPDIQFAAERLLANNPRLPPERALELARQGTRTNADGVLNWAFDQRVASVFVGLGADDSARYWPQVRCPTCIISGALSAEYWRRAVPAGADWNGEFAAGELDARAASFQNAEHVVLEGSGHMVHFDEPERLSEVTLQFLQRQRQPDRVKNSQLLSAT